MHLLALSLLLAATAPRTAEPPMHKDAPPAFRKPSRESLRRQLPPEAYACTQEGATEAPFRNAHYNRKEDGIYLDVVSGEPLFSSADKFDSGTGWPSFTRPLVSLTTVRDSTLGMVREEVRSPTADSHLGHVFDDGPGPTGQRFCINSASLRFVPLDPIEGFKAAGLGAYLFDFAGRPEVAKRRQWQVATFAGGCFWGVEELFAKLPGVIETQVGYAGGDPRRATYEEVTTGTTGHAEAVQVLFDRRQTSLTEILLHLFSIHDPTTKDRQGNDRGSQYRSAIFVTSAQEHREAEAVLERVRRAKKWQGEVVTTIEDLHAFARAEAYHQKYLDKHPGGYRCHVDHNFTF